MAYERYAGPLGPERADFHAALITAAIANLFASKDKATSPADHMPDWDDLTQQAKAKAEEEAGRGDD
jgi:hypothetical protein